MTSGRSEGKHLIKNSDEAFGLEHEEPVSGWFCLEPDTSLKYVDLRSNLLIHKLKTNQKHHLR